MTGPPTPQQLETFMEFLEKHPRLAKGRMRSTEDRGVAQKLWHQICSTLNKMGTSKTVKQWQKVWADRKYLAKKAAMEAGTNDSTVGAIRDFDFRIISLVDKTNGDHITTNTCVINKSFAPKKASVCPRRRSRAPNVKMEGPGHRGPDTSARVPMFPNSARGPDTSARVPAFPQQSDLDDIPNMSTDSKTSTVEQTPTDDEEDPLWLLPLSPEPDSPTESKCKTVEGDEHVGSSIYASSEPFTSKEKVSFVPEDNQCTEHFTFEEIHTIENGVQVSQVKNVYRNDETAASTMYSHEHFGKIVAQELQEMPPAKKRKAMIKILSILQELNEDSNSR